MGNRRRNLFVLLFVLGLLIVSGVVIAQTKTQLGLDLKGGVQLVFQGRPTPQQPEVTPEAMDRAVDIIRSGCNKLGVEEVEVSRIGTDQIQVGIPGATSVGKATECASKPARLYFYDWEPNVIAKHANAKTQSPNAPGTGPEAPFDSLYQAVLFASKQQPVSNCPNCTSKTEYYLFDKAKPHRLIDGPETVRKDLYVTANGRTRPKNIGVVVTVPQGTLVVSDTKKTDSACTGNSCYWVIKDKPALSGTDISDPKQNFDPQTNAPNVTFGFNGDAGGRFHDVTRRIAQRGQATAIPGAPPNLQHFAIVLDQAVVSRPVVDYTQYPDGIDGRTGAQISDIPSVGEAQQLADFLQRGALPIDLKLISQSQVSATLGQQALDQGLKAGIVGLIIVILFLLFFYRFLGLVASVALGAYGVIFFALLKLIPVTLTLPGIAGLILTIGVAADSNIVIFERIKEEVRAGRSIPAAIAAGYRRGIATIIDANVVTLMTAFILFVLASAGVKGFALTLGLGTIVSLLTAVVFTQALLGSMSRARFMRSPAVLGAGEQHFKWRFDFMGASRWFFSMSGIILTIGAIALATKQLNLGIDFKSGTRVEVSLKKATDENGVRDVVGGLGLSDAEVQRISNPGLGNNVFQIQSKQLKPIQVAQVQRTLDAKYGVTTNGFDSTSVGPTFGTTVAEGAIRAIIFSLLVICGYVALRFDPKFALPVLIALFHDVLITAGVYSLTGREVTSSTIAAFLTILGYSMYDTIIVFDRIRENLPRMPRAAFSQVVNRSMSEVLTRSLATSLCTLLPIAALLLFGGTTLKDFAFAIMVGVISGAYSSIFIASPVLTAWKERETTFVRRRTRIVESAGHVPAYAEEIKVAKVGDVEVPLEDEEEEEIAAPEPEPPEDGDTAEPLVGTGASAAESRLSDASKKVQRQRRQRQKRRKHGRNR
jgi:SecD/SecF fusion protein